MHAWTASVFHNLMNQLALVEARPLMKWFLKVWMARSDAFTRWLFGSTSCHSHCSDLRDTLRGVFAWLSVILRRQ